eukprot:465791-Rhodomonas_salina.1
MQILSGRVGDAGRARLAQGGSSLRLVRGPSDHRVRVGHAIPCTDTTLGYYGTLSASHAVTVQNGSNLKTEGVTGPGTQAHWQAARALRRKAPSHVITARSRPHRDGDHGTGLIRARVLCQCYEALTDGQAGVRVTVLLALGVHVLPGRLAVAVVRVLVGT